MIKNGFGRIIQCTRSLHYCVSHLPVTMVVGAMPTNVTRYKQLDRVVPCVKSTELCRSWELWYKMWVHTSTVWDVTWPWSEVAMWDLRTVWEEISTLGDSSCSMPRIGVYRTNGTNVRRDQYSVGCT